MFAAYVRTEIPHTFAHVFGFDKKGRDQLSLLLEHN